MVLTIWQADLNNPATVKAALQGAYGVFAVTNYWESQSAEVEIAQGKAIADAAKVCGLLSSQSGST